MVGELASGRLTLHEVHRFSTHQVRAGDQLLWDILAIFEEIKTGLREATKQFGPDFDGISVDTWGVDYVLLDPDGRLLGYPHHYRDSRTDGVMEATWETVPRSEIYRQTGIQFMPINTVYQLLAEQSQLLNLLTVADKLLLVPDYLLYLLCGVQRAEYTIASTTQLADPHQRDWAWDLIDQLDLSCALFPEVIEPGTPLGTLRPDLAEETGININIPVIAGAGHDTAAAVAAVPALENDWA
jgi:rhamnulokinase